eukprot:7059324-Pyramimonas_sp.AAC.1
MIFFIPFSVRRAAACLQPGHSRGGLEHRDWPRTLAGGDAGPFVATAAAVVAAAAVRRGRR